MNLLLELLISGVSIGAVYALLGVAFVVVFRATRVVNFAQGSFLLLGGVVISALSDDLGFLPALGVGVLATALASLSLHLLLTLRADTGDHLTLAIVTIGVDVVLTAELIRRLGTDVRNLHDPFANGSADLGGVLVPHARIAALITTLVVLGLLLVAFRRTRWGTAMRAAAEDREAAALVGIRQQVVSASAWVIAGSLAALAVVFIAAYPTPGLSAATAGIALKILPAVIIGGLDSPAGAVVGGLLVGVAEQVTLGYGDHVAWLGSGFAEVAPYVVMLGVLAVRPAGLFGTREAARV